jgi:hypothetical protein
VPHEVAAEVPAAAARIAEAEARLIGPSKEPGFSYEVLERIITGGGGQH